MNRRTMIAQSLHAAAALAMTRLPSGLAQTTMPPDSITGPSSLKAHAEACGVLTGSAVDMHALATDPVYRQTLIDQYSIVVGENCMKFQAMQPQPGTYDFTQADALLAFAEANGMKLRGHNFVWHEALPAWFASTVTKENARRILIEHIQTIATRYKGKIHSWDVVNEAIWMKDGRPDGLRISSPWFQLLGPEYLELAFRTARQADPTPLLTYNDYGIEYDDPEETAKRAAVLALLRRLKAAGLVDALGVQSHLHTGSASFAKGTAELLAATRQLGLKLFVTEMDVKDDPIPTDDTAERDRAVAAVYRNYLTAMLRSPDTQAVLTWGIADKRTWLNHGTEFRKQHPTREQRPLPLDTQYRPKPAFYGIRDAFDTKPAP